MQRTRASLIAALAVSSLLLAGCAGGGSTPVESSASVDLAAAEAGVAAFEDPTPFPVTTPLESLPAGAKVAYVECGTTVCVLFGDLMETPAEMLGLDFDRVDAGLAADSVATAFDTVLAGDYDAVIVPAIEPALWSRYLDELNEAGIPVISTGNIGLDPEKVVVNVGSGTLEVSGRTLADWATVDSGGPAEIAIYVTPEIGLTSVIADAFVARMEEVNPDAEIRVVDIPVAQFGSTAPQVVVDDLIAHPNTTTAVFTLGEAVIGLPSALQAADITDLRSIQYSPVPATLDGVKDGSFTAGLASDIAVVAWTLVDATARAIVGQELDQAVVDDDVVMQIVTADNLPEDTSNGWSGYPDFVERFTTLWGL